jgi:hypothetical protein
MKPEIKELRKCQKALQSLQYTGYPFQLSIVIDIEEQKAWVDGGKEERFDRAFEEVSSRLATQMVFCHKVQKGTWLQEQRLSTVADILKADNDDFEVNVIYAKFYFALVSAVFSHKRADKSFVFACLDADTDWLCVEDFQSLEEIENFRKDYFTE